MRVRCRAVESTPVQGMSWAHRRASSYPSRMRAFVLAILIAGCTDTMTGTGPDDDPDPGDGPVSYSQHVQPIWDRWCVGCHNPGNPRRQEPYLQAATSHAALTTNSSFCYVRETGVALPLV